LSEGEKSEKQVVPDAMYECVRCGTPVAGADLAKLPEPICGNCGYRVFRKVRGPTPRRVKGE
jgi:DNA-directed RNA polymerase subunit RPC12/RpoP